jgi:hypothetical protein
MAGEVHMVVMVLPVSILVQIWQSFPAVLRMDQLQLQQTLVLGVQEKTQLTMVVMVEGQLRSSFLEHLPIMATYRPMAYLAVMVGARHTQVVVLVEVFGFRQIQFLVRAPLLRMVEVEECLLSGVVAVEVDALPYTTQQITPL